MSVLTLKVNEVMRTLSAESSNPFVVHDKEVDIVRFAINSGFADIVLDGQVALRAMYQRPRETEVRAQTLTYYDTDGLHNYYDWQLSQSDLAKNGSLMVALCILDISGGEVSEWHTTPCEVRVLSTIHTDDSDEGDAEVTPTVKERVAVLESMIQRVASGAPIVVASTSAMTDTNQIYVLSTNGRWYYHNGSAWVAGGEYGAVSTDTTLAQSGIPADAKAVGDVVDDLKSAIDNIEDVLDIVQTEWTGTATHESSTSSPPTTILDGLTLENGVSYTFTVSIPSAISKVVYIYLEDSDGNNIQTNSIAIGNTSKSKTFTAAADYSNVKLEFGVALANVTATGVFTKNAAVTNAIDSLEADVASVTAIAESTASDLSKILVVEQKGNAFQIATDILDGRYYYRNSGALANGANANFYSYIVKVIPHSTYTFNNSDIVLLDGGKVPLTSTESWDYRSVTTCNSGNAEYMAVNAYKTSIPAGGCIFSQGTELDDSTYSEIYYAKSNTNFKPIKSSVSGNIAAGGTLLLGGRSAIKDGQTIVFKSKISSFDTIRLDFTGGYSKNYIEFDTTNLTVKNSSAAAQVLPHGLTIANEATLIIRIVESHALISLTSGGVSYETDLAWNQTGAAVTEYQISTTGTVCTGAVLASTYSAVRRRIWYFGDSYIVFGTDTRIPYYAYEYECGENICFSGASGGTSGSAVIAFHTLLAHGTPEFAVFATGMNDGSDSTDPASGWLSAVQNFISLCETEGITPVLCTVPTVPTVNNEQKNQWVRNSGYRYIDYASAVGADSSGVWYSGMIASDNIHPSALGGNALFTQLATDLPEIFSN